MHGRQRLGELVAVLVDQRGRLLSRKAVDDGLGYTQEQYRLAQELDSSEARAERLEQTNKEVSRRLVTAMETIRAVLDR